MLKCIHWNVENALSEKRESERPKIRWKCNKYFSGWKEYFEVFEYRWFSVVKLIWLKMWLLFRFISEPTTVGEAAIDKVTTKQTKTHSNSLNHQLDDKIGNCDSSFTKCSTKQIYWSIHRQTLENLLHYHNLTFSTIISAREHDINSNPTFR